jgi:serine/threonine protein kinase
MEKANWDDAAAEELGPPIVHVGEVILGKFRVEKILGEGGMGVVVAAKHLQLDEVVALKFMRPHALRNPEQVLRFSQEARAAAKLKSEHVARVLDVSVREDGTPFIVMEYLHGKNLEQLLTSVGPLPVATAAEIIIQACEGLAEAHARGIIHRDIKPANLFLVDGRGWRSLKILDFGISKAALGEPRANGINTQSIMGSPCYMSPEQLRSTQSVDHRADVWSLGAVLYELLTNCTAFDYNKPITELIVSILEQPPPPIRSLRPDVPAEVEAAVEKCLRRDPGLRFQNAAELAIALVPFAHKRARVTAERAALVTTAGGLSSGRPLELPPSIVPDAMLSGPGSKSHADTQSLRVPRPAALPSIDPMGLDGGKYQPIASLGRGGMADVFLAVARGPLGFNKLIVIKRLRRTDDATFRDMFLDEARLAARLNHPNVVQTYEVGEDKRGYFIAMEYLEGQPLNVLTRETFRAGKRLDPLFCARIVADALAGLHYAHELADYDGTPLNIVHRDVSPHNLFVTYEGQVKLVDFGIAKAALSSASTEVGVLKGKVGYMSPEQAMGEVLDRRADLFAMGIVLWELLTFKRLMGTDSAPAILHRLLTGTLLRPRDIDPNISPELDAITARALSRKREDRFSTALEMREALLSYLAKQDYAPRMDALGHHVQQMFLATRERVRMQVQACMQAASRGVVDELSRLDLELHAAESPASRDPSGALVSGSMGSAPGSLGDSPASSPGSVGYPHERSASLVAERTVMDPTSGSGSIAGLAGGSKPPAGTDLAAHPPATTAHGGSRARAAALGIGLALSLVVAATVGLLSMRNGSAHDSSGAATPPPSAPLVVDAPRVTATLAPPVASSLPESPGLHAPTAEAADSAPEAGVSSQPVTATGPTRHPPVSPQLPPPPPPRPRPVPHGANTSDLDIRMER